jgi:hypothetical protein
MSNFNILSFPPEILELFLLKADPRSLLNLELTCRTFHSLLYPGFWNKRAKMDFGSSSIAPVSKRQFLTSSLRKEYHQFIISKAREQAESMKDVQMDLYPLSICTFVGLVDPKQCFINVKKYGKEIRVLPEKIDSEDSNFIRFNVISYTEYNLEHYMDEYVKKTVIHYSSSYRRDHKKYETVEEMTEAYKEYLKLGWVATYSIRLEDIKSLHKKLCILWGCDHWISFVL